MTKKLHTFILLLIIGFFTQKAIAQYVIISGTVYDVSARRPLEAVAVISTSGVGTVTDSVGKYSIKVRQKDSIWFSLIGKSTIKYSVDTITNPYAFDIMIHIKANDLPEVKVRNNYYKFDSIQNRKDYAKVFNFKKPGLRLSTNPNYNPGGVTVGFDLNEIINMFRFKRNRQILALQKRLLQQEHDKYIDHRYTKLFVKKLTSLKSPQLETFMALYRPEYSFLLTLNDLEFGYYIETCYDAFINKKPAPFKGFAKQDEDEE